MLGATRIGEINRTIEMILEIMGKHENDPKKGFIEAFYILRSTNRTDAKTLKYIQEGLEKEHYKKVIGN